MCRQLGFDAPSGGVDLAVSAGLLWPTEAGWRFQHGTLRDALLLESKTEGRLADLHRAIAEHLRSGADQDWGQIALRRASGGGRRSSGGVRDAARSRGARA